MYFLPAFRFSRKSMILFHSARSWQHKTPGCAWSLFLLLKIFKNPAACPAACTQQWQKRLYPNTSRPIIKISRASVVGISTFTAMPTPMEKRIRPHNRLISFLGFLHAYNIICMNPLVYDMLLCRDPDSVLPWGSFPLKGEYPAASADSISPDVWLHPPPYPPPSGWHPLRIPPRYLPFPW